MSTSENYLSMVREIAALRAENERLRAIVPEVIERLNDELCDENERLREALSALTSACTESKWPLVFEHMMPMTLARAALAAKEPTK